MLRLIEPDEGKIWFRGTDLRTLDAEALRKARRQLQMVFQDPYGSLNPRRTILDIVGGPLLLHGLATRADVEDRVRALLHTVGLQPEYVGRYPHEFSGGQRQRIGIARAVALEPDLIVCDEAVAALDVSVRAQVLNLLLDLQRGEHALSYLFVTHDLSVVRHIASHVVVMYLGRVVEQAPTATLFAKPLHPYSQALLSAAPGVEPGKARKRIVLTGDVPSPLDPPSGCRFRTRCPIAEARCAQETPVERELAPGHVVACHFA
jgi:oligopeptide/dipeptide ABC transporter ATP-binding protein